jgi:hypothetical protein
MLPLERLYLPITLHIRTVPVRGRFIGDVHTGKRSLRGYRCYALCVPDGGFLHRYDVPRNLALPQLSCSGASSSVQHPLAEPIERRAPIAFLRSVHVVIWPSICPLLSGRVRAAGTAACARCQPLAKCTSSGLPLARPSVRHGSRGEAPRARSSWRTRGVHVEAVSRSWSWRRSWRTPASDGDQASSGRQRPQTSGRGAGRGCPPPAAGAGKSRTAGSLGNAGRRPEADGRPSPSARRRTTPLEPRRRGPGQPSAGIARQRGPP